MQLGLLVRAIGAGWHLRGVGDTRGLQLGRCRRHNLLLHEFLLDHLCGCGHCGDHLDLRPGCSRLGEGHSLWGSLNETESADHVTQAPLLGVRRDFRHLNYIPNYGLCFLAQQK